MLQNYYFTLKLASFFTPKEFASIVIEFIESTPQVEKLTKINTEKLMLLHKVVEETGLMTAEGFTQFEANPPETRSMIFPILMKHIKFHIVRTEEEQQVAVLVLTSILKRVEVVRNMYSLTTRISPRNG